MSFPRFTLYFVSLMACAVVAFPHWAPARSAASPPDSVPGRAARATARPPAPKATPSARRKALEPLRLVASN